ncbi:MAG: acyl-CoA-binding protein [Thalassobius sp.]|nr:acyl-CoA-binding protein [Thalassovita sp.]
MKEKFELAREEVQKLKSKPNNTELLKLYGLYKQATEGDVKGDRPGTFDIKGQFKYDFWKRYLGKGEEESMGEYIALVDTLKEKYGMEEA